MKFTIIWTKQALDDLSVIWMSGADKNEKQRITSAADKVDSLITSLMQEYASESKSKNFHLQVNMLNIVCEFSPLDCMIKVIGIWKS